jgi:hypothetical protein
MAVHDRRPDYPTAGLPEIRAERTTREIARINKRLGLVLLLVALPYLLVILGLAVALLSGGSLHISFD